MIITPENLHTDDEFIHALGLSVEARELLHILDNHRIFPLSRIVGTTVTPSTLKRIEKHTETVREIFSGKITKLLQINRAFGGPNEALQTAYQGAIRSMISSPIQVECDRMILLLWNQFNKKEAPMRALGKPVLLGSGK